MLMSYWIADQLGNPTLPDAQRHALSAAIRGAMPVLRGSLEGGALWAVASAVRRNGAIMMNAERRERGRLDEGPSLEAFLEALEDGAAHHTIQEVELHSPDLAAWLTEIERRKRPELRNALRACGLAPWDPVATGREDALRRLLLLVTFAAEQASRSTKLR